MDGWMDRLSDEYKVTKWLDGWMDERFDEWMVY